MTMKPRHDYSGDLWDRYRRFDEYDGHRQLLRTDEGGLIGWYDDILGWVTTTAMKADAYLNEPIRACECGVPSEPHQCTYRVAIHGDIGECVCCPTCERKCERQADQSC